MLVRRLHSNVTTVTTETPTGLITPEPSGSVRTHPIIVGRSRIQSDYSSAIDIAHVQVVVASHVTAKRVARGYVQQVSFRVVNAAPSRHKAAARRRRRNSFNSRGNCICVHVRKLEDALRPDTRLVAALGWNGVREMLGSGRLLSPPSAAKPSTAQPKTIRPIKGKGGRRIITLRKTANLVGNFLLQKESSVRTTRRHILPRR